MYRIIAAAVIASLSIFPNARAGTKIADADKSGPVQIPARIGVGPYVAIFGGANVDQSAEVDSPYFNWDFEPNTGWFAGLKLGYAFKTNSFLLPAVELEGFYNRVDFERSESTKLSIFRIREQETANFHQAVIMLNGILRFDLGRFRPYLGAGIGLAHTWYRNGEASTQVRGGFTVLDRTYSFNDDLKFRVRDDEEWSFAAQGIAGFEIYATDRISIFAEYKALWLREAVDFENFVSHLIGGGIRLYF